MDSQTTLSEDECEVRHGNPSPFGNLFSLTVILPVQLMLEVKSK